VVRGAKELIGGVVEITRESFAAWPDLLNQVRAVINIDVCSSEWGLAVRRRVGFDHISGVTPFVASQPLVGCLAIGKDLGDEIWEG